MKPRLIVFDLDGTLIDSAYTVMKLLNELRATRGAPKKSRDEILPWLSSGGEDLIRNVLDTTEPDDVEKMLRIFRLMYIDEPVSEDLIYPGVREVLSLCRSMQIQTAISTNKPRMLVDRATENLVLRDSFDLIVSPDEVGKRKPHPENLLLCSRALNVPVSEVVFIGDSSIDQETAHNAGVKFYFHSNGYNDGVNLNSCDYIFGSYVSLAEYIRDSWGDYL
jgi:phosphoglycolate phosphatase